MVFNCGFNSYFPDASDIKHLVMNLLAICKSSFVKHLLKSFAF